jgi:hypothetical protein
MKYKIIHFEDEAEIDTSEEWIHLDVLTKFLENAEIIIFNEGTACSKDFITGVIKTHRGAGVNFKGETMTYGYNVTSKLVKTK